MSITPDILRRLSALKLPAEQFQAVLAIVADACESDPAKAMRSARNRRYYEKRLNKTSETSKSDVLPTSENVIPASESDAVSSRAPAFSVGEEVKISPEDKSSGGADAPSEPDLLAAVERPITPSAMLYRRAREAAGEKSAPFVTKLLRQNGGDIAATRQMVEQAAQADRPLAYLAGMVASGERKAKFSEPRGPPVNGKLSPYVQGLKDAVDELEHRNRQANESAESDASGDRVRAIGWPGSH